MKRTAPRVTLINIQGFWFPKRSATRSTFTKSWRRKQRRQAKLARRRNR